MKAPWVGRTGAAKIAVWSATVPGVSLGLCGANYLAMTKGMVDLEGPTPTGWKGWLAFLVIVTGLLEGLGMLVGSMGLFVAIVFGLWDFVAYLMKAMRGSK